MVTLFAGVITLVLLARLEWRQYQYAKGAPAIVAAADTPAVELVHGLETTRSTKRRGNDHAKVVVIEYADFECPYCGRYARDTFPTLGAEFIDTGLVSYEFRHFPIPGHSRAQRAGEAAECARDDGRYWQMHERLFAHQDLLSEVGLRQHARAVGMDSERFDACLSNGKRDAVMTDAVEGARLGVMSTPTFIIGKATEGGAIEITHKVVGAREYGVLRGALRDALRRADDKQANGS